MDVPEEVIQQLTDIQSALEDVEEHLQPFLEAGPKEMAEQLTPLERLKAHLALAQAAVVLYTLDRQLDAAKLEGHPIQKELERLAKYEKKVQDAVAADDLARTKPGASLNIDAANRFIDAAIPDLSAEQKARLRSKRAAPDPAAASAAAPPDAPGGSSKRACSSSGKPGSRGSKQAQEQEDAAGRQRKQPSKKQAAQELLDELVAEVTEQEGQQPPAAATGQPPAAAAAGADVDAAAFLQDVMASLDG